MLLLGVLLFARDFGAHLVSPELLYDAVHTFLAFSFLLTPGQITIRSDQRGGVDMIIIDDMHNIS